MPETNLQLVSDAGRPAMSAAYPRSIDGERGSVWLQAAAQMTGMIIAILIVVGALIYLALYNSNQPAEPVMASPAAQRTQSLAPPDHPKAVALSEGEKTQLFIDFVRSTNPSATPIVRSHSTRKFAAR